MNETDNRLQEQIKQSLQDSSENLEASIQSRITRARYNALEQLDREEKLNWWAPAAMITTACLALVVITLLTRTAPEPDLFMEDMDMISTVDDLELYEDLEFYEWLDEYELPT